MASRKKTYRKMASSSSESGQSSSEMVEVVTELSYQDDKLPSRTLETLNMMRKNRNFCDVILRVDNAELYAHRAVLASASPHFLELFSTDDEKKGSMRGNVYSLQLNGSHDRPTIEKIIDYIYTARLEVSADKVESVYLAADYLRMEGIASECLSNLIQQLNVDNCIKIRSLPGISRKQEFLTQVDSFITSHFDSICKKTILLTLPFVRIEVLNQTRQEMSLFASDSLCQLVIDWIERSFEVIPLETMTEKTHLLYLALDNSLQDCSEIPSNDISNTEIVQQYKREAEKSAANPPKPCRKQQMKPAKPRIIRYSRHSNGSIGPEFYSGWSLIASQKVAEHTFLALVSVGGKLASMTVYLRLNEPNSSVASPLQIPEANETITEPELYCELTSMKSVRCGAGCTNLDNLLIVCGGYDRAQCLRTVEVYDSTSNLWCELRPMHEARGRFNIAVVDGKAYAVGGCNGTTELASVERYDFLNDSWVRSTPLPLARSNTGVCSLQGKIYCIGGWNGQVGIRQCHRLVPGVKYWDSIAQLQTGRYQAGVCAFDNKVWVAGGCDGWNCLTSVEFYDPATDAWTFAAPMITARRGCGFAELNGKLYAVGGSDGVHSLSSTEVYDPAEKAWSPGPNMTTPRSNVGVAVINGRLYAVGGFSGKNFLDTIEYLDENTIEWTTFCLLPNEKAEADEAEKLRILGSTPPSFDIELTPANSTNTNGSENNPYKNEPTSGPITKEFLVELTKRVERKLGYDIRPPPKSSVAQSPS